MVKRFFDVVCSLIGLFLLTPFFVIIATLVFFDDKGPVFFVQERLGKKMNLFPLLKFRTMKVDSNILGNLTIGLKDARITTVGYYLRKYKLDELPQLINVFLGHMSLVGPRPEDPKYLNYYSIAQKDIFNVLPGITSLASLEYIEENELLAHAIEPEKLYINQILPHKLFIDLKYVKKNNLFIDIDIILRTFIRIII